MTAQYTIKEAGYAFLYIANDNATQVDVYFDDVVMTQSKSNVIQSNEYYAFGMQTANSWTRENTTGNNFLANAGTELNTLTQLYDLDFRNFDPILGRLHQVDPLADYYGSWSPYKYGFNNPVNWNDPSGAADSPGSAGPGFDPNDAFDRADRYMSRMNSPTKMYGAIGDDDIYGSGVSYTSGGFWVGSETTTTISPNSKNNNSETRTSTSKFWVPGGGDDREPQTQRGPGITQHATESVSLEQFLSSIKGLSYWDVVDQIEGRNASKTVLDSQPSGPKLRYVRNPHDGNIMDMRHVLVVGFRHGRLGGSIIEVLQYFDKSSRGSAMNEQDFYSNMIGSNFSMMYKYHIQDDPTRLSELLEKFFSTPARINQDYWNNYRE